MLNFITLDLLHEFNKKYSYKKNKVNNIFITLQACNLEAGNDKNFFSLKKNDIKIK